jgi:ubiquinone/menaquinone biosynthesis C-methylase UbiE
MVDLNEYREKSLQTWDKMSAGWHSWREYMWEQTAPVREWLVSELDPKPGDTILDVAAGVGDTGFAAAEKIAPEGRLISTDFSSGMVDAARKRADELGVTNAEFKQLDAEKMDLEDDSVDRVLSRWGYMLMADPAAALEETNRVLRPDGRLVFAVWASADKNLWAATPAIVLVERGAMPPPEPGAPGIFALADQNRIRELVTAAGFADPKIEEVPFMFKYDELETHWRATNELAGPIAAAIAQLSPDDQQAVREEVASRMEHFRKNGGYEVPATPIGVVAEPK